MPLLFPPGARVLDADGNPLNDAQVRVYDANTTDLADLFSDPGLSVALSNPVITNAEGYPTSDSSNECLIWAANGDYDVAFLNSGGTVLANWDDAPTFGEAGAGENVVSGNGRYLFTGAAGAVMLQIGDPSPDDVGGTFTVEGWAGTQLDSATIDSAAVNAGTSAGALKENSKKLASTVYTEATAFAAAATVDIPLTNLPAGIRSWEIEVWGLVMSATGNLYAQLSYDNGATYKAGASDYYGHYLMFAAGGLTATADLTGAQMQLATNPKGTADLPNVVRIKVITVDSGTAATRITTDLRGINHSPAVITSLGNWFGQGGYGRATHLRLLGASGTLTGNYLVRPLRGYGET